MYGSHMKGYPTSIIIRKTTQGTYSYIPIKLAKMKKRQLYVFVKLWSNWSSHDLLVGVSFGTITLKNYSAFSMKVEDVHLLRPRHSTSRYTCNRNAQKSAPKRQA